MASPGEPMAAAEAGGGGGGGAAAAAAAPVTLHMYDLTRGMASALSPMLLGKHIEKLSTRQLQTARIAKLNEHTFNFPTAVVAHEHEVEGYAAIYILADALRRVRCAPARRLVPSSRLARLCELGWFSTPNELHHHHHHHHHPHRGPHHLERSHNH